MPERRLHASKAHLNEHGPEVALCPTACSAAAAPRGLRPAVRMPTTARPQQPAGVRRRRGDFDVRYTAGGAKSGEARRPAPAEFGGGEAGGVLNRIPPDKKFMFS